MSRHADPAPAPPHRFRVGAWDVVPAAHEIARGEEVVRVEPKVMALLVLLAEHAGEVVARETILDALWPGVFVTEDALSRAASKLRRALDDDAQEPRYVETIPKAGYRLIAPMEPLEEEARPEGEGADKPAAERMRRPRLLPTLGVVVLALILLVLGVRWGTDADAPTSRRLTHLPGVETHPALSPDGRFLAFVAAPRDAAGGADLYVQGLDDPTPRRLTATPEEERHPTWRADGQLAFLQCAGLRCAVLTVPVLSGGARRLAGIDVAPWGLSGSGDALVAVARDAPDAPYRVVVIDPETHAVRPVSAPPPNTLGDLNPALSPAGDHVAFVRHGADGSEDVFIQPLSEEADAVQLTRDGKPVSGLAWMPGGDALVVSVNWDAGEALWRVPVNGNAPERVPLASATVPRRPSVAANRLVFEARTEEVNLYRLDLDGGAPAGPVLVSTDATTQPALRPDGARIAFVSNRSGEPALWTARIDGTDLARLASFDGARLGAPRWSPDGQQIVFEAQQGGEAALYLMGAEGGPVRALANDVGYPVGPRWGPEGHFIYFGANRGGDWQVWRIPVGRGRAEQMTSGGGFVGEPTPDGRTLVFARTDAPGLWRMPLPSGPAARIDSTLAPADWGSWSVTTAGVFLVERGAEGSRLVRLDLETGARTVVRDDLGPLPTREPALAVARDGSFAVVARADQVESALVLVEPFR